MKKILLFSIISLLIYGCCVGQAEPWPTLYFSLSQNKAMQGETITLDMNGTNIFDNEMYTSWKVYYCRIGQSNSTEIKETKVKNATQLEITLPENIVGQVAINIDFEGNPPKSLGPCESSNNREEKYYSIGSADEILIIVDENGNEITE